MREKFDDLTVLLSLVTGPAFILLLGYMFFEGRLGRLGATALACLGITTRANLIVNRWAEAKKAAPYQKASE